MKIPKELKKAVDASEDGSIYAEIPANSPMPPLEQVGALFVNVRDDIAKTTDVVPEDVILIAVKVVYKIGDEKVGRGAYYAIGSRELIDPKYAHILQEIGE